MIRRAPSSTACWPGQTDPVDAKAVVLVEGRSDARAVEAVARLRGVDLDGTLVVPMGGATNIGHFLRQFSGLPVASLCDEAEAPVLSRWLARSGLGSDGCYVCVRDLEDELIRALGTAAVEQVIAAQGEARSLRTFGLQPAQRDRSRADQLRRFLGTRSGRKIEYAGLLAGRLSPGAVPAPLRGLLDYISGVA